MKLFLNILLQGGPPDPIDWGDPEDIPISDQAYVLFVLAIIYGSYKIYQSIKKAPK
ncbi:MAG: hypothetical protein KBE91_00575 [Bacteroidia bacterium]|jgi:hypothetical protein|nr:hypothetical protein [Bacteroidia bacterium]MBP9688073.1 hypothetical protein [Bacteroidia bacterium]